MDYSLKIGGQAGQGLQTIGGLLAKVFSRLGYHVFTHQDYMSRIRGGHNFYQIRFADRPISCSRERVNLLVALDKNTIGIHRPTLAEGGLIIYDAEAVRDRYEGEEFFDLPAERLAVEKGGDRIMANSAAVGGVLGLLGLDLGAFEEIVRITMEKKGEPVVRGNIATGRAGSGFVREYCRRLDSFRTVPSGGERLMLIDGVTAMGLGALLSGVKLYSAYPMTPSTGVMTFLASKAKAHGLVVEQAEDEIAAINMALGASYAGVRAMTGTSGGGFALMQEGFSLAGMTETPLVIAEMQRPGPATGLPTRTEQGDLLFVVHAGHGEFPRVVFAPGTPEQAFLLTNKAFDLAEKYQVPVFVQGDQYLADSEWTGTGLPTERLVYTDYRLRGDKLAGLPSYKRYQFTDNGVSPLAVPGASKHLVVVDSDEHDEEGHIIEDAATRNRMVEKRLFRKLPLIRQEMAPPSLYGAEQPEIVLAGFGSTWGVMREVVDALSGRHRIAMLHFSEVFPLPLTDRFDYLALLRGARVSLCIESNATGQFARLLRAETGFGFTGRINRYDGRPFTLESLLGEVHAHLG
ncbi:MAG: 2-oxoacid:acceptor oxidoreductase subunit alpha [Desulfobacteraceae bacterium]|nr:2-oxoacid:acceptor oxidoreductase subunit alpha [Desulfobacteraceae bacterium]